MKFTLRDEQRIAVDYATTWRSTAQPSARLLLASPTGSGKSLILLKIQEALGGPSHCAIVTPRVAIVAGFLEKLGLSPPENENGIAEMGADQGIYTPVRYRNRLLFGEAQPPETLLVDEVHHAEAQTYSELDSLLGKIPWIGITATPYRGTPRGTAALRERWGDPEWIITLPQAAALGVVSLPTYRVVPLVDDDLIEVANGELVAERVEAACLDRLNSLVEWCRDTYPEGWGRPTMFACPGIQTAGALAAALDAAGLPSALVSGVTPAPARAEAFRQCLSGFAALVQIQVVSEGVDLPVRRLIDLAATLSPVRWLQQLGRITRPVVGDEPAPEYICTNRNLLRHGYLLEGCLPLSAYKNAEKAFGGPTKRAAARAIGLEALGRLRGVELPLAGGVTGICYNFNRLEGVFRREYYVIVHPLRSEPFWATRTNKTESGKTVDYGRWVACDPPETTEGFTSIPPAPISEKQLDWWKKCAGYHGLDPEGEVNRKNFPALPVLSQTKRSL